MKYLSFTFAIMLYFTLTTKAQVSQNFAGGSIAFTVTPVAKLNQMQVNKIKYDASANLEERDCPDSGFAKDKCFVCTFAVSDRKKVQAKIQGYMAGFGSRAYFGDYARFRYKDIKIAKLGITTPVTVVFDLEDQGNGTVKAFINFKMADGTQISTKTHAEIGFEIRRWMLHMVGKYKEEKL